MLRVALIRRDHFPNPVSSSLTSLVMARAASVSNRFLPLSHPMR